jgi:hypothetical protein
MSTFVMTNTAGYIITKFQDMQVVRTEEGLFVLFRHPIF